MASLEGWSSTIELHPRARWGRISLEHEIYPGCVEESLYDQVGGATFFSDLVDAFYVGVEADPILRAMYPDDLSESKQHLTLFLAQYWGGPSTYMELRGHPRLRMRHEPFRINRAARDSWLAAMRAALDSVATQLNSEQAASLWSYFESAANQLRNV